MEQPSPLGSKTPKEAEADLKAIKAYCKKEEKKHLDPKSIKNTTTAVMLEGMPRANEALVIANILKNGLTTEKAEINLGLESAYSWTKDEALDMSEVKAIATPEIALDVFHGLALFRASAKAVDSRNYTLDEQSDL